VKKKNLSDTPKRHGLAALSKERRREIASMGGKATRNENRSFSKSPETAAAAGRKGGQSVPVEKRTFSADRTLAREAGRKGGLASQKRKAAATKDKEVS
jgi:general stress protein YciG